MGLLIKASYLPVLCAFFVVVSTVLLLVAFSTNYWLVSPKKTPSGGDDFNLGVWKTCYRFYSSDPSGNRTESDIQCVSTHDWTNLYYSGWQTSWVGGLQATIGIAFAFGLLSVILILSYSCYVACVARNRESTRLLLIFCASLSTFVSVLGSFNPPQTKSFMYNADSVLQGLAVLFCGYTCAPADFHNNDLVSCPGISGFACCLMIALIICGSQPTHEDSAVQGASLAWSFELGIAADVMFWFSAQVTFIEFARVNLMRR